MAVKKLKERQFCDLFIKVCIYSSEKGYKGDTYYFCPKKVYERGTISVKNGINYKSVRGWTSRWSYVVPLCINQVICDVIAGAWGKKF